MKPTDEACKEFRRVYNNTHVSPEAQVRASLTASFAVQFSPVEEHAELVNQLRSIDEERLNNEPYSCEQLCKKAADALESVLAERDALKAESKKLREALKPFADIAKQTEHWSGPPVSVPLYVIRAAAAAIRSDGDD